VDYSTNVRLTSEVEVISSKVETLEHRLYGNGQPGDIQVLHKSVTDIKMTIARWGAAGSAIAGLGVLISQWANILKILGH
jgi:hypothetical protein